MTNPIDELTRLERRCRNESGIHDKSEAAAIAAWNRRAPIAQGEPVAWAVQHFKWASKMLQLFKTQDEACNAALKTDGKVIPLYTHPAPNGPQIADGYVVVPRETLRNWMTMASIGPGGLYQQIEPYAAVPSAPSQENK